MPDLIDAARTARPVDEVAKTVASYRSHYQARDATPSGESQVRNVVDFYDLVTNFYEYGCGQCFHFAVWRRGDTLQEAIDRHEDWIAAETGMRAGIRALDLGCGVGGPMRHLARTTGAHITGVNLNKTQLERARACAASAGLAGRIALVDADFSAMPLQGGAFDVVYAIGATCHAIDLRSVFAEAFRVLKPGGRFVGYEWCTTAAFDETNAAHVRAAREIQESNALPPLRPTAFVDDALRSSGFALRECRDVAGDCEPGAPWWRALNGEGGLRARARAPWMRALASLLVPALEWARIAPRGASEVSALLNQAADAVGGQLGIFTPMYRWSAVKP